MECFFHIILNMLWRLKFLFGPLWTIYCRLTVLRCTRLAILRTFTVCGCLKEHLVPELRNAQKSAHMHFKE